jgi:asparagine synthase (glutamine-hydrolysing)
MCGIATIFNLVDSPDVVRQKALSMASSVRHRGPDWSGIYADEHCILAHERLAIVDVTSGAQPLVDSSNGNVLAVNGEIYNHRELAAQLKGAHPWKTASDCECLLYLYAERGADFLNKLNGIFAFTLYDQSRQELFVARDHIGIIPLYIGWDAKGQCYFASELKALINQCTEIEEFPPGHSLVVRAGHSGRGEFVHWYQRDWQQELPTIPVDRKVLATKLEEAVHRQLMSDVPYGVLISGGLDSSLIGAIAARYAKKRVESNDAEEAWWPRLHSFSVG